MFSAGLPCEKEHSLCNGRNELCIGRGPAYDADDHGFQSNLIIAGRQAGKAAELWFSKPADLSGETWLRRSQGRHSWTLHAVHMNAWAASGAWLSAVLEGLLLVSAGRSSV